MNASLLGENDLANFCDQILLNSDDQTKRRSLLNFLEKEFCSGGIQCKMYYFGSTINGIGFYNSDMDIYVELLSKVDSTDIKIIEQNNQTALKRSRKIIFQSPLSRLYTPQLIWAKCPIIKLEVPKNFTQKSKTNLTDLDINLSHPLGVFNSWVINVLVSFEPRILRLCAILKHWAKLNDLINLQALKSYTLVFMIIFFLQNCDPPFILSLDHIFEYSRQFRHKVMSNYEDELSEKCRSLIQHTETIPSTFDLLHRFFT